MWADRIVLRLGPQRDILVAIAVDTEHAHSLLLTLLGAWLDRSDVDPTSIVSAFTLMLAGGEAPKGPKLVPQLRFGSHVMARSREPDDVVRALAAILGGVHADVRHDAYIHVGLRPFLCGEEIVLVDAERPLLVNDTLLSAAGAVELPAWTTAIRADQTVTLDPYLGALAWARTRIKPPVLCPTYRLRAIVSMGTASQSGAETFTMLARLSLDPAWFRLLRHLYDIDVVRMATNRTALRRALRDQCLG